MDWFLGVGCIWGLLGYDENDMGLLRLYDLIMMLLFVKIVEKLSIVFFWVFEKEKRKKSYC